MKQKIIAGLIITLLSSTAYSSIKDKKAMRGADASIAAEILKVKAACGNPALEVKVNWDEYKTMIAANEEVIASERYKSEWVISHSGLRTVTTLEALSEICKDDADYKEEIALLTQISVLPKADLKDTNNEFSLKGNTLTVKTGHRNIRSVSDFSKKIKAVY